MQCKSITIELWWKLDSRGKTLSCFFDEVNPENHKSINWRFSTLLCSVPAQDAALPKASLLVSTNMCTELGDAPGTNHSLGVYWEKFYRVRDKNWNKMHVHSPRFCCYIWEAYYWVGYTHNSLGFGKKKWREIQERNKLNKVKWRNIIVFSIALKNSIVPLDYHPKLVH